MGKRYAAAGGLLTALILAGVLWARYKAVLTKTVADATWVTISLAASFRWLNENQGVWGFFIGVIGLGVSAGISWWFKSRALAEMRRARDAGIVMANAAKAIEEG